MGIKSKIRGLGHSLKPTGKGRIGAVDGISVLSAVKKAAERRKKLFKDKIFVPEIYTVCLSKADMADIDPIVSHLKTEILAELKSHFQVKNYRTGSSDITVDFQVRYTFPPGTMKVITEFGTVGAKSRNLTGLMVVLKIISGKKQEALAKLAHGTYTLGRGKAADLLLPAEDALVSKIHCRLDITEKAVFVRDLNSANGTLINGQRISGKHQLNSGDRLMLGNTEIEVQW